MLATSVDRIYSDIDQLLSILSICGEISLRSSADDTYRKSLLLSIASYFESTLSRSVLEFVEEQTSEKNIVVSLVKAKAISRQYHTWFNWEGNNANSFFALFGAEFKESATKVVKEDSQLDVSIKSFLELGRDRNRLVHQDYASFPMEKTSNEIYQSYKSALRFIEWVPIALRKYAVHSEAQD
ncbi:HEPN domain-containing protein [Desulfobacter postgatei]|uniref:HEPN domain-containing protein n=1 Tax=Desulfobacter postgatei TaxID=2293 RepID=UPI00259B15B6|nr:HEPN domain-containing protein [uncultured Desulfobacter sp.]